MGIALVGSSDASPALDDEKLLSSVRVLLAHDNEVYGGNTIVGRNNLLIGRNIDEGLASRNTTILGENVVISHGVQNTTSLGRSGVTVSESDAFLIGDFLSYRQKAEELSMAKGMMSLNSQIWGSKYWCISRYIRFPFRNKRTDTVAGSIARSRFARMGGCGRAV